MPPTISAEEKAAKTAAKAAATAAREAAKTAKATAAREKREASKAKFEKEWEERRVKAVATLQAQEEKKAAKKAERDAEWNERHKAAEEESKARSAERKEATRRKNEYISERRILNWAIIIRLSKYKDGSYKTLDRDDRREINNDSLWRWLVDSFDSIKLSEYAGKNKSEQMKKSGKSHEEQVTAGYLEYFRVLYRITDSEDSAAERIAFSEETTPELRKRDKLLEMKTLPKMKAEGGYTRRAKGKKRGTRKIRR
jgi:hypothetical protein